MRYKKVIFLALILLLILNTNSLAASNEIDEIFVDVEILDDGTGIITQTWKTNINEGTELFIPMENLNHMDITYFIVSDKDGHYSFKKDWDSSDSFEEKMNQNGFLITSQGYELVFGVSKYGENTYTIQYDLINMVQSFSDRDGFNVRFINDSMTPAPKRIGFRIHKNGVDLSSENAKIWSFGYGGNIKFQNGEIVGQSTSPFGYNNYLNVMIALNKGVIEPAYIGDGSFDDMKKIAFVGSDYVDGEIPEGNYEDIYPKNNYSSIFSNIPFISIIIALFIVVKAFFAGSIKWIINYDEVTNRNIIYEMPFGGEILPIYRFLSFRPEYNKNKMDKQVFLAYLIKWFSQGYVTEDFKFIQEPRNIKSIGKNPEQDLWKFLKKASAKCPEGLASKDFETYMEKNYTKYISILRDLLNAGEKIVKANGFLKVKRGILRKSYMLTETGIQEMLKISGMEKYIKSEDEQKLQKRFATDSNLLMLTTLMGLDSGKIIDSEEITYYEESIDPGIPLHVLHSLLNNARIANAYGKRGISRGFRERQERLSDSGSSGFGGGSSSGGGGGFSGGGSGGGVR